MNVNPPCDEFADELPEFDLGSSVCIRNRDSKRSLSLETCHVGEVTKIFKLQSKWQCFVKLFLRPKLFPLNIDTRGYVLDEVKDLVEDCRKCISCFDVDDIFSECVIVLGVPGQSVNTTLKSYSTSKPLFVLRYTLRETGVDCFFLQPLKLSKEPMTLDKNDVLSEKNTYCKIDKTNEDNNIKKPAQHLTVSLSRLKLQPEIPESIKENTKSGSPVKSNQKSRSPEKSSHSLKMCEKNLVASIPKGRFQLCGKASAQLCKVSGVPINDEKEKSRSSDNESEGEEDTDGICKFSWVSELLDPDKTVKEKGGSIRLSLRRVRPSDAPSKVGSIQSSSSTTSTQKLERNDSFQSNLANGSISSMVEWNSTTSSSDGILSEPSNEEAMKSNPKECQRPSRRASLRPSTLFEPSIEESMKSDSKDCRTPSRRASLRPRKPVSYEESQLEAFKSPTECTASPSQIKKVNKVSSEDSVKKEDSSSVTRKTPSKAAQPPNVKAITPSRTRMDLDENITLRSGRKRLSIIKSDCDLNVNEQHCSLPKKVLRRQSISSCLEVKSSDESSDVPDVSVHDKTPKRTRSVKKAPAKSPKTPKSKIQEDITSDESSDKSSDESSPDKTPKRPRNIKKTPAKSPKTPKSKISSKTPIKSPCTPKGNRTPNKPCFTPSMPSRVSAPLTPTTSLEQVRKNLHVSAVPMSLPCREMEYRNIYNFVENKIRDNAGGCMYISGVPGTGKTATVHAVIRCLKEQVNKKKLKDFKYIEVNGLRMTEPRQVFVQVLRLLTGQKRTPQQARDVLAQRFCSGSKKNETVVLLVDEVDMLRNRRQDVIYNLFDWPSKPHSHFIVLTIANTMDLPERLLKGRVTSRLGLTRLVFQPYTYKQLQEIVMSRLQGSDSFSDDAVELVARKVAAYSGDVRRALDICRRASELVEEGVPVTMPIVNQVISQMINSANVCSIRACSKLEKIFLQAVVAENERTGVEETTFISVYRQFQSLCALASISLVNISEAMAVVSRLGTTGLLLTEHSRADINQSIFLNISADDIHYSLQQTPSAI